jgi:hypothetical protein
MNKCQQFLLLLIAHGAETARQHEDRVIEIERSCIDIRATLVPPLARDLALGDQL